MVHFLNLFEILNVLKKKITLIDFVFLKLRTPKTWLDKCLKSPVLEDPSTSNMVDIPKHCSNLETYSLKWDFLDIYLTTFWESVTSKIQNLWGSSFLKKILKFNLDFKNAAKNSEKVFYFLNNCIWIGIVKLSLLRKGCFSLAANVLTSSSNIWHVNKRQFFEVNFLGSDRWVW